jgi:hypothetical protein
MRWGGTTQGNNSAKKANRQSPIDWLRVMARDLRASGLMTKAS